MSRHFLDCWRLRQVVGDPVQVVGDFCVHTGSGGSASVTPRYETHDFKESLAILPGQRTTRVSLKQQSRCMRSNTTFVLGRFYRTRTWHESASFRPHTPAQTIPSRRSMHSSQSARDMIGRLTYWRMSARMPPLTYQSARCTIETLKLKIEGSNSNLPDRRVPQPLTVVCSPA